MRGREKEDAEEERRSRRAEKDEWEGELRREEE